MVANCFLNAAILDLLILTFPAFVRTPTTCSGFPPFFRFFAAIGESSSWGWSQSAVRVDGERYGYGPAMSRAIGGIRGPHLGLGLLEPELHAHLMEHGHRRREMFRGRPAIACSSVELAEGE